MADYASTLNTLFSQKLIQKTFDKSIARQITNQDYEGEVKDKTSVLKILSLNLGEWANYTGSLTYANPTETVATLTTDQEKSITFQIRDISKFKSWIKDPKSPVLEQQAAKLGKLWDTFVLGLYADAAAGNWYGTSYTAGTVAVAATTGVVTGSATTFASGMVGKPFKAAGHTKWYRVKSYSSTTEIVIEDDSDDTASAYTGGAISGGAAYEIQANTVLTIDGSTNKVSTMLMTLKQLMDEKDGVPAEGRFCVLPPVGHTSILKDTTFKYDIQSSQEEMLKNGYLGMAFGFKLYMSNDLTGDNTSGFHVLAGHVGGITFAEGLSQGPESLRLEGDFADGYRELRIYGAKVADERRKFLAHAFVKFTG